MKNYGVGVCRLCGEEFIKVIHNQRYCKNSHTVNCFDCGGEYNFIGAPQWLRGVKDKEAPYYCKGCRGINSKLKARETKLLKYGDENYSNKEKRKLTMMERYGAPTTLESPILLEKFKNTMVDRYGGEFVKNGSGSLKNSASRRANAQGIKLEESLYISKIFSSEGELESWVKNFCTYKNKDKVSYGEISMELGVTVAELSHIFSKFLNLKKKYIKLNDSKFELIVVKYIEDTYIVDFKRRVKTIGGFELDIYFEDLKIAFEVNDFATHSRDSDVELLESFKNMGVYKHGVTYHNNKLVKCGEAGVELIYIWEDEIFSGEYRDIIDEKFRLLGVVKVSV